MSATGDKTSSSDRVFELLSDYADGLLDAGQRRELLDLLRRDPDARAAFIENAILNSLLSSKARQNIGSSNESDPSVDSSVCSSARLAVELPNQAESIFNSQSPIFNFPSIPSIAIAPSCPSHTPLSTPPPLGFLATTYHGTVGFFSQEVPFSILIATLVFALGGIIGSVMTVHHYTQFAGQSQPSERSFAAANTAEKTSSAANEKDVQWVGRITGMVDCKWSNNKDFLPPGGNYVALGRKYKLDSGLMEITYNTGAKVILQGPVTYEAESTNGGYMSVGKLTGKVDVEKAKGFFVRTPTAVVTDLGTEFGVEVDKAGETLAHVFLGEVALAGGKGYGPVRLSANQSALVKTTGKREHRVVLVSGEDAKAEGFVRSIQMAAKIKEVQEAPLKPFQKWQAFSQQLRKRDDLLAYYDFQRDPDNPCDESGCELLRNRAKTGHQFDGHVWGTLRMGMAQGRFPGKDALKFR